MPQMQALSERLDAAVGGHRLVAADALGFAALKTVVPAPEVVVGRVLTSVGRRGKYLILGFDDGHRVLLHLSQAGRVDIEATPKTTRPKGAVVRFRFATPDGEVGPAVLVREFGTERKAAWWVLAPGDDGKLTELGPEVDADEFADLVLHGDEKRRIHTWLRDQHTVAGVGRGYADDALWRAGISPYAQLSQLDDERRAALLAAVRGVLHDGIEREREREGGLAEPKLGGNFEVHGRAGTPCPKCGETLRRVSYESHEVAYCPTCQTDGKVLADRRMSRLVK
ncbi:MAG: DNA-formamidopyrimidine glycosylase family protein [Acidimicrobiia bacterium]